MRLHEVYQDIFATKISPVANEVLTWTLTQRTLVQFGFQNPGSASTQTLSARGISTFRMRVAAQRCISQPTMGTWRPHKPGQTSSSASARNTGEIRWWNMCRTEGLAGNWGGPTSGRSPGKHKCALLNRRLGRTKALVEVTCRKYCLWCHKITFREAAGLLWSLLVGFVFKLLEHRARGLRSVTTPLYWSSRMHCVRKSPICPTCGVACHVSSEICCPQKPRSKSRSRGLPMVISLAGQYFSDASFTQFPYSVVAGFAAQVCVIMPVASGAGVCCAYPCHQPWVNLFLSLGPTDQDVCAVIFCCWDSRAKEWRIGGGDGEEAQTRCCRHLDFGLSHSLPHMHCTAYDCYPWCRMWQLWMRFSRYFVRDLRGGQFQGRHQAEIQDRLGWRPRSKAVAHHGLAAQTNASKAVLRLPRPIPQHMAPDTPSGVSAMEDALQLTRAAADEKRLT